MKKRISILFTALIFLVTSCYPPPAKNFDEMRMVNLATDRMHWEYNQTTLPDQPLTYNDVIHLVINQNFELLLKAQEYAVQHEAATGERLALLPELNLNLDSYHRNSILTVTSRSIQTGQTSVVPSIASRRDQFRTNINALWSLVDFGLTYFRSRQAQDRAYNELFQLERLSQTLILDATRAYWNALIYQKIVDHFGAIVERARTLNDALEQMVDTQTLTTTDGLDREHRLLELENDVHFYEDLYVGAKQELAALMGIPASTPFELDEIAFDHVDLQEFDIETLEETALLNRPELSEGDVSERISRDEVHASIVQMLPDFEVKPGHHTYDNPFYKYTLWWDIAYSATWNLLSLPSRFAFYKSAQAGVDREKIARLSLSVGVLSQVNIAYVSYLQALRSYEPAARLASVGERMRAARLSEIAVGMTSGYDLIHAELQSFKDLVEAWIAYAEVEIALEELAAAVGMPLSFSRLGQTVSPS